MAVVWVRFNQIEGVLVTSSMKPPIAATHGA